MRFRFTAKLLFLKLVVLFVFFGLIVGYLSFLIGTAIGTFELFQNFKEGFGETVHSYLESDEPDLLYKAFVEEPDVGRELNAALSGLVPDRQKGKIQLMLYSYIPADQDWILLSSQGITHPPVIMTQGLRNDLNMTLGSRHVYKPDVYMGGQDSKIFYFDLTGEDDRYAYVLKLQLEREGFFKLLESEKNTFYTFTILVLLFSFILGSVFAKSISRPINRLTDRALDLSRGDMNVRFKSARLDDIGTLARSLDRMSVNLKHRFDSMQTMNRIDRAVLSSVSRKELLNKVAGYISEQFNSAAVAVLIHREDGLFLSTRVPHTEGFEGKKIPYSLIPEFSDSTEEPLELNMSQWAAGMEIFPSDRIKGKSINIPIIHNENRVATFSITLDKITEQDKEALGMLSDQTGVALRSMYEVEQKEQMSLGILMALTRSVDAKSRWTAGHSERVARLSEALAEKLDLDDEDIQTIRVSALLHDIGKLGIPEVILDKPDKLSESEYEQIKSHPAKGDEIIKDIPGFDDVKKGVRHHHEKWDGTGYPDGLAGQKIPLIARILTLADVYDAITEDRPYRKGFSKDEAFQFLEDQRGILFDPDLLDSFLSVLRDS